MRMASDGDLGVLVPDPTTYGPDNPVRVFSSPEEAREYGTDAYDSQASFRVVEAVDNRD